MTRRGLLPLILLGAALGGLLYSAIRPVWAIDPDAAFYVSLARSLASDGAYAVDGIPHTKYPPGLPVVLSGVVRVAGAEAYAGFHGLLVTAVLASVFLAFAVVRTLGYPDPVAWAVAAGTGLSQTLFDLSVVYVRTEPLFLALSLAALLATWRALSRRGPAATLIAGALLVGAIAVRLAGVGLLAVPLLHVIRRPAVPGARGRALLLLLMGGAALLAWQARAASVARDFPGATDYGAEFRAAEPRDLTKVVRVDMPTLDASSLARRVEGNAAVLARAMAVLLTNVDRAGARLPVGLLLTGLVLVGLHVQWWRSGARVQRTDAAGYVIAMFVLCLLWPFNQQERFYVPLLPLLLLAAGAGVVDMARLAGRLAASRAGRALLLGGLLLLVLLLAAQRSDHPALLGRWSVGYAALLLAGAGLWVTLWRLLARGALPALRPAHVLAAPLLLALPFLHHRCIEWPRQVADFETRRAEHPVAGPLARIDVDPRLEQVALFLAAQPPDTLVMTDVPRMLQVMSGRRCVPFVYRLHPPEVLGGDADLVFYTREIPEAAAVMDAVMGAVPPRFEPVFELPPVDEGGRLVVPAVVRPR